jgi:hypothetical protein
MNKLELIRQASEANKMRVWSIRVNGVVLETHRERTFVSRDAFDVFVAQRVGLFEQALGVCAVKRFFNA